MSLRSLVLLLCVGLIAVPVTGSPVARWTPAPSEIYGITPSVGITGSVGTYDIYGNGFVDGAQVYLWGNSTALHATYVTVITSGKIQCTITIPSDASIGLYSIGIVGAPGGEYLFKPDAFTVIAPKSCIIQLPGSNDLPTDTDTDGLCDDVNGNGRMDFADVVLYFAQLSWIADNEPLECFDYNANGRIDFSDVVWLFNHL